MNILFLHTKKTHDDSIPFHLSFIYSSINEKTTKEFYVIEDPIYYGKPEVYQSQDNQIILQALMESPFYHELWALLRHNPIDIITLHCSNDNLVYTMCLSFLITKESNAKILLISPLEENFYPQEIFMLIKPDYLVYQPSSKIINDILRSIDKNQNISIAGVITKDNLDSKITTTKPIEQKHSLIDPKTYANLDVIDIALKTIPAGKYSLSSKTPCNAYIGYSADKTIKQLSEIIKNNENAKKEAPLIVNLIDPDFFHDPEYTKDFLNQLETTELINNFAIQINTSIKSMLNILTNHSAIIEWLTRNQNHRIFIDTYSFSDQELKALQLDHSCDEIKECINLLNKNGLYHFHKITLINPFSSLNSIVENLTLLMGQMKISENYLIPQFTHYYLLTPSSPAYNSISDEKKNDLIIKIDEQKELRIIHPIISNDPHIEKLGNNIGYLHQQIYYIEDTPNEDYTINLQILIDYIKTLY